MVCSPKARRCFLGHLRELGIVGIWQRLARPQFGLADRISEAISLIEWRDGRPFTNVRNTRELLIACDFSGSHARADFEAFAFLVGAIGGCGHWMEERSVIRKRFLPDGRRMAYKALNDRRRRRALLPFLQAADLYPGNLFIFVVAKKIANLFDDPGTERLFPELVVAVRNWKKRSFQRLLLVATLGSLLVSGLSESNQDVLWVVDQDEIAANPTKHNHAGHVIHHCISTYAPANTGQLVFLTTEADFINRMIEDVVAIADLAAGSMVDAFGTRDRVQPAGLWVRPSASMPAKGEVILNWLAHPGEALRRVVVVLDQRPDRSVVAWAFQPLLSYDGFAYIQR